MRLTLWELSIVLFVLFAVVVYLFFSAHFWRWVWVAFHFYSSLFTVVGLAALLCAAGSAGNQLLSQTVPRSIYRKICFASTAFHELAHTIPALLFFHFNRLVIFANPQDAVQFAKRSDTSFSNTRESVALGSVSFKWSKSFFLREVQRHIIAFFLGYAPIVGYLFLFRYVLLLSDQKFPLGADLWYAPIVAIKASVWAISVTDSVNLFSVVIALWVSMHISPSSADREIGAYSHRLALILSMVGVTIASFAPQYRYIVDVPTRWLLEFIPILALSLISWIPILTCLYLVKLLRRVFEAFRLSGKAN